MHTHSATEKHR